MKQFITIITLTCSLVLVAAENLVERSTGQDTSGNYTVRILAPAGERELPYDKPVPMVMELVFPETASFQSSDLNFDDIPCFDCDDAHAPEQESQTATDGRKTMRFSYKLEPLQPPYELPAITATLKDEQGNDVTVTTEPFTLNIAESTLSEGLEDEFLEPADPPGWDHERFRRLLPWLGGALLVLVLLGGSIWRTLRNRRPAAVPQLTPYEIADRKLTALLAEKLPEAGEYKHFYERISGILREYLENRFDVQAPRLTTEEFLHVLTATPEMVQEHRELLQKFLTACDLVKFAAQVPGSPEIDGITHACRTFLDTTQPPPENQNNTI